MIDFYLAKRKLAIEVDELGHFDRDQTKENKGQKELEEYLWWIFIRINPDEKDFSAYGGHDKIQTFLDKLKDEKLKKLKEEIRKLKTIQSIINRQDFKKAIRIKIWKKSFKKTEVLKTCCQKNTSNNIKMTGKQYVKKKENR